MTTNYLTYLYLLTALHTGGSSNEGNLMGIAREVHTEFTYLPASGIRGKNRAELEALYPQEAGVFFGQKIKDGQQPTEGEVWFADGVLLFFPIASLSHHLVWITCPLWLERYNRWLDGRPLQGFIKQCRDILAVPNPLPNPANTQLNSTNKLDLSLSAKPVLKASPTLPTKPDAKPSQEISSQASSQTSSQTSSKSAIISFNSDRLYLQTALLKKEDLEIIDASAIDKLTQPLAANGGMISEITKKLVVVTDEDCIALVETGLQREVRVALEENSKIVKGGSFRSEEAIPPETVLFFPWGMKPAKEPEKTANIRPALQKLLQERLQFGGLEGLGRGWADLMTVEIKNVEIKNVEIKNIEIKNIEIKKEGK
jgi:CRISPR-associated protein Cmr4